MTLPSSPDPRLKLYFRSRTFPVVAVPVQRVQAKLNSGAARKGSPPAFAPAIGGITSSCQKLVAQARNQKPNIGRMRIASRTGFTARVRLAIASAISITNQRVAQIAVTLKIVKAAMAIGLGIPFRNHIASTANQLTTTVARKITRIFSKTRYSIFGLGVMIYGSDGPTRSSGGSDVMVFWRSLLIMTSFECSTNPSHDPNGKRRVADPFLLFFALT
jgi:hypothetical protein